MTKLMPLNASSKNDVIVGIPPSNPLFTHTARKLKAMGSFQASTLLAELPSAKQAAARAEGASELPYHVDAPKSQVYIHRYTIVYLYIESDILSIRVRVRVSYPQLQPSLPERAGLPGLQLRAGYS